MDLLAFRKSCGECTDEELIAAVLSRPFGPNLDQATSLDVVLDKTAAGRPTVRSWPVSSFGARPCLTRSPHAVQQLLHTVRSTQNLIVLGAAAMGKIPP